jgi:Sec-independent protein translocase protein TatA
MSKVEEPKINDLLKRIEILEARGIKSISHRMSYLTWNLANPVSLIFLPTFFCIGVEILLNNWGSDYSTWSSESLTKSTNWTIPILVVVVGLVVAFGNKIYLIIQERGDMNLLAELRADINGVRRDFEIKEAKRDAERKEAEAKRDAERKEAEAKRDAERKEAEAKRDADMKALFDKHDQEIGTLLNNLTATNTRVTVIETKQEI